MKCRLCGLEKDFYTSMTICKDCHKKRVMDRYSNNIINERKRMIIYNKEHRDVLRAAEQKYYSKNVHKWIDKKLKRRGLLVGSFTILEWKELCNRYHNVCLCCGKEKILTVDHIVPISEGGMNTIDNIQPLCKSCNSRKGTKIIDYR